ncbi:hypothetical protein [Ralstonia solanacearum]|uniref:hypothetical protein n=1 Tax=Ralstonia solanacearum TaxID=305 RepID=UPI000AED3D2E|nr:hypothetical protein [Ralstonia solanacearum]
MAIAAAGFNCGALWFASKQTVVDLMGNYRDALGAGIGTLFVLIDKVDMTTG